MHILSVNVGVSRALTVKHQTVQTGIFKTPASGPVPVTRYGLQGDVRVEPRKMGLDHHAVYAYPFEHYAYWQEVLGREAFPMGQFGENLTVTGLLEEVVRIGDVFRMGSAVLQVAQPRIPCAKFNARMGMRFSPLFLASRKVGYYLRVLTEGHVAPGDSIELLERDDASPTMEEFVRVTQFEAWDTQGLEQLLRARDLMPAWREMIESKLARSRTATGWHGLRELELVQHEPETGDLVSLFFKCARGRPLSPLRGGQQLMVVLGGSSANQQRQAFPLSSNPHDLSAYRITIDSRSTDPIVAHLAAMAVGDRVRCASSQGALMLALRPDRREAIPVLISQGLGLAPMLSLLYELEDQPERTVWLFHNTAGPRPEGLLREYRELISRNPHFSVIEPSDPQGPLPAELVRRFLPLALVDVHIAGPGPFTESVVNDFTAAGVRPPAMMVQAFS